MFPGYLFDWTPWSPLPDAGRDMRGRDALPNRATSERVVIVDHKRCPLPTGLSTWRARRDFILSRRAIHGVVHERACLGCGMWGCPKHRWVAFPERPPTCVHHEGVKFPQELLHITHACCTPLFIKVSSYASRDGELPPALQARNAWGNSGSFKGGMPMPCIHYMPWVHLVQVKDVSATCLACITG